MLARPPSRTPAIDNLDALDVILGDANQIGTDAATGIVAPFEFVCLSCSSQGVRVVIPEGPGGRCPRCQPVLVESRAAALSRAWRDDAQPQPHPGTGAASSIGLLRRFWRWIW